MLGKVQWRHLFVLGILNKKVVTLKIVRVKGLGFNLKRYLKRFSKKVQWRRMSMMALLHPVHALVHQVDPTQAIHTHAYRHTHRHTHAYANTYTFVCVNATDYQRALDTSEEAVVGLLNVQLLRSPYAESEVLGSPFQKSKC